MDINKVNKQHGFTIIEVALVLAIAGLIFLVVFLALPALQNSQKDIARKQDVARIVSALQSYMADNQGDLSGLATSGNTHWYTIGDTVGLPEYVGKLSQLKDILVYNRKFYAGDAAWLKTAHTYVAGVAIGQACIPGSLGYDASVSTADASVYAVLLNGAVYCASM